MDSRKLNAIVKYVSRSVSAAALMIWGVFNMSYLMIQYVRRTGDGGLTIQDVRPTGEGGDWVASAIMCGFFGLLPFVIGSWLLYQNIASSTAPSEKNSSPE